MLQKSGEKTSWYGKYQLNILTSPMDPERKVWTLFSLLNMESPKVQKVSHWLSKYPIINRICSTIPGGWPWWIFSNHQQCRNTTPKTHPKLTSPSSEAPMTSPRNWNVSDHHAVGGTPWKTRKFFTMDGWRDGWMDVWSNKTHLMTQCFFSDLESSSNLNNRFFL